MLATYMKMKDCADGTPGLHSALYPFGHEEFLYIRGEHLMGHRVRTHILRTDNTLVGFCPRE